MTTNNLDLLFMPEHIDTNSNVLATFQDDIYWQKTLETLSKCWQTPCFYQIETIHQETVNTFHEEMLLAGTNVPNSE